MTTQVQTGLIADQSVTTQKLADANITNAKLAFDGGALSYRNKIINGNFDFWQRGTVNASTDAGGYLADRWQRTVSGSSISQGLASFTLGQTAVDGEPAFYWQGVVTSVAGASNYAALAQPIESVRTLAGQTAVLTFWAMADASKNIAVELMQSFGTGGSPSASVQGIGATTCALTTSWKKFSVPITIPSISGKTLGSNFNDALYVNFWFDAGSTYNSRTNSLGQQSGTFSIARVQLEKAAANGSATPYEDRPKTLELALCQRYCYVVTTSQANVPLCMAANYNTATVYGILPFPVTMRAAPSTTFVTATNWNATGNGSAIAITLSQQQVTVNATELAGAGTGFTQGYAGWIRSNGATTNQVINSAEL